MEKRETTSAAEICERREYLEHTVAVTCFLGKQEISSRGHNETEESDNKQNFHDCIKLLEKFDPFLQRYTIPLNTTYIYCSSQNEMIECCSQEVTAAIVHEIRESQMYAIMADEARDGRTEQLAHYVRYVSVVGVFKAVLLNYFQSGPPRKQNCSPLTPHHTARLISENIELLIDTDH